MLGDTITAKVVWQPVSISEQSIRSDLLFDDANGIDSLPNQAIFDVIQLMGSSGNLGGHSSSDKSLSGNEGEMTLQSGKKFAKGEPSVQRDPLFDEIPEDTLDHIETKDDQDVGRTRDIVGEEKENDENVLSTEDVLSTDKEKVSTDKEKVSTDRPIVSTDGSKVSTDRQIEGTDEQIEGTDEQRKGTDDHTEEGSVTQTTQPPPTSIIFGDDETIAKVLLNMSQAKVVSIVEAKGKFEEIQALYEKIKRSDEDFISIGSVEDERLIKKMNEKGIDSSKKEEVKEESKEEVKEESKEEEDNRKRKLGTRKKMKSRKRRFIQNTSEDDSEKENDELRLYLT
ncbi:hypothetical protein Tco_0201991 [Tanacetum coccineum]